MLVEFNERLLERQGEVADWMGQHRNRISLPIYTSVDMRSAGFKISPVDTNLYPAGFNNLCTYYNEECTISFQKYISSHYKHVNKILVLSEANTRNKYYAENLKSLLSMLEEDGYEVRAGIVAEGFTRDKIELEALTGTVQAWRVDRRNGKLRAGDFMPDIVLSNNDFTEGVPEILKGADQPVDPAPELGWHMRRKSDHFVILEHLMQEFGDIVGMDPWLFYPLTRSVKGVDFQRKTGMERIAAAIDHLVEEIGKKYREKGLEEKPFVFIKSDYGTYGMGVISVSSGDEFLSLTSKQRKKMRRSKGGLEIYEVIAQEGIPTRDEHMDCPVEPVIYIVGGDPVGGFYRINCERTIRENLNSRGMTFSKLCFHELKDTKPAFLDDAACSDTVMMRVYGTIASICAVATGYEYRMITDGY